MLRMADVELTSVKWLWFPYIPFGKLTIIQGNPGAVSYTHLDVYKRQTFLYLQKFFGYSQLYIEFVPVCSILSLPGQGE